MVIFYFFLLFVIFYSLDMTVPDLKVAGKYEMTGKAFVVIKDSFGPFNVSFILSF